MQTCGRTARSLKSAPRCLVGAIERGSRFRQAASADHGRAGLADSFSNFASAAASLLTRCGLLDVAAALGGEFALTCCTVSATPRQTFIWAAASI
jgi:hypothetical protein